MKKTENYVLSRRIDDGVVILRKISDDGCTINNLTKEEVELVEKSLLNSGLPVYRKLSSHAPNTCSSKDTCKYLQERFEEFLKQFHVDHIVIRKTYFDVGGPSFNDNGTIWYRVYPSKTKILVEYRIWDEGKNDIEDGVLLDCWEFASINDWMKSLRHYPTSKKSRPRKSYR